MLQAYIPVLLVVAFVIANAILILALSHVLSTYRLTPAKLSPYDAAIDLCHRLRIEVPYLPLQPDRHRKEEPVSACQEADSTLTIQPALSDSLTH